MLHQVLQAIESAQGPLLLSDLSRQLELEPAVVAGMIAFWVRKGRLQDDDAPIENGLSCHSQHDKCGPGGCPFVIKTPQTYSIPMRSVPHKQID